MNKNNKNRKTTDISLIFFILFSAAICVESYKLGLGSFNAPNPGLFPFLISIMLGVLATFRLLVSLFLGIANVPKISTPLKRIFPLMASFFAYPILTNELGFVIPTFLLVVFLLKVIEAKSWRVTIVVSVGLVFFTYLIFKILLGIQLPRGFIGF